MTQANQFKYASSQMGDLLDIAEVATLSGMAPSALRFYESEGIIASAGRRGQRRQYDPDVLTPLAVAALCRRAGFSLAEVKAVLATNGDISWKELAARKMDELRAQARHLTILADQIEHALRCPSANFYECEHFQAALCQVLPVGETGGLLTHSGLPSPDPEHDDADSPAGC
jgi:DNA-binding transcriptional MerR regulator